MPQPDMELETRARLLLVAAELFAAKGFRATTIREICSSAGVNVASVNYHFGGKKHLYEEVLAYANRIARSNDMAIPDNPGASLEERLHTFIRQSISFSFNKGNQSWYIRLINREMAEPTPMFENYIKRVIAPRHDVLRKLLGEMMGLPKESKEVRLCAHSIIFQCRSFFLSRRVFLHLNPDIRLDKDGLDLISDHIYAFSLAAIRHYATIGHPFHDAGSTS